MAPFDKCCFDATSLDQIALELMRNGKSAKDLADFTTEVARIGLTASALLQAGDPEKAARAQRLQGVIEGALLRHDTQALRAATGPLAALIGQSDTTRLDELAKQLVDLFDKLGLKGEQWQKAAAAVCLPTMADFAK